MSESLGMKLRAAREAKGLTLEQLATLTKINPSFIEAMENGRWDLLPGRVYLKTFTKLCAEVLDLNINELYGMIDGGTGNVPAPAIIRPEQAAKVELAGPEATTQEVTHHADYRLPIVALLVLGAIAVASYAVKNKIHFNFGKHESLVLTPVSQKRSDLRWEMPWQRPASDIAYFNSNHLRIEAQAPVWLRVIADGDTVYSTVMAADSAESFAAENGYLVSVGKNENIRAYLNGVKVPALGASEGPLRNYPIKIKEKENSSHNQD